MLAAPLTVAAANTANWIQRTLFQCVSMLIFSPQTSFIVPRLSAVCLISIKVVFKHFYSMLNNISGTVQLYRPKSEVHYYPTPTPHRKCSPGRQFSCDMWTAPSDSFITLQQRELERGAAGKLRADFANNCRTAEGGCVIFSYSAHGVSIQRAAGWTELRPM